MRLCPVTVVHPLAKCNQNAARPLPTALPRARNSCSCPSGCRCASPGSSLRHCPRAARGKRPLTRSLCSQPWLAAPESIGRFQAFLRVSSGPFAANAEYWIGEGLYSQGKYGEALAQFQKVNSQWPSHHKNMNALLKTGMTLSRMGDKEGAAQAYKKLLSQFPGSEAAGIARSRGLAR